jgi:very-short-patch-repair endonuclease
MQQDNLRTERACNLRKSSTPTERRLWYHLRGRRFAGFKFRRQTPIAGYVADFYCAKAILVLELDGESHVGKETYDAKRVKAIEAHGFRVLRIWDTEVYDNIETVLKWIWHECQSRVVVGPLTPDPSPPRGEGRKSS